MSVTESAGAGSPRYNNRSLRVRIEELTALGLGRRAISERLECSPAYVKSIQEILGRWGLNPRPDTSTPGFAEHDAHVAAVLAEGGFEAHPEVMYQRGPKRFGRLFPVPVKAARPQPAITCEPIANVAVSASAKRDKLST